MSDHTTRDDLAAVRDLVRKLPTTTQFTWMIAASVIMEMIAISVILVSFGVLK